MGLSFLALFIWGGIQKTRAERAETSCRMALHLMGRDNTEDAVREQPAETLTNALLTEQRKNDNYWTRGESPKILSLQFRWKEAK